MRQLQSLAAILLLCGAAGAHAEHFQYEVQLQGTYSIGGTDGCYPPEFDQPACPRAGSLSTLLSFDTPSSADGSYLIADVFGDITDFTVNLGTLAHDSLFGGVNLSGGVPNGSVQSADGLETFTFDWATHQASYVYDFGDHNANGNFAGTLSVVAEPSRTSALLAGLLAIAFGLRRRRTQSSPHAAKSGFSKPLLP